LASHRLCVHPDSVARIRPLAKGGSGGICVNLRGTIPKAIGVLPTRRRSPSAITVAKSLFHKLFPESPDGGVST
jgi:hypothetical protein